jgi:hypothetical protein
MLLLVLLVLLLVLLLSEGACAITFLLTNRAGIGGVMYPREVFFFLSLPFPFTQGHVLSFVQRPLPRTLLALGATWSKKQQKKNLILQRCKLQRRELQRHELQHHELHRNVANYSVASYGIVSYMS